MRSPLQSSGSAGFALIEALASLVILLVGGGVVFAGWYMRRAERKRALEIQAATS